MDVVPDNVRLLSQLFVVMYMFSVALETTRGQILLTFKHYNMLTRVLLVNLVIVPSFTVVLLGLFDLPPDIKTGLLILGLSPGGLFALQFARVSEGNRVLAIAILFLLSAIASILTPLLVKLLFPVLGAKEIPLFRLMLLLLLLVVVPLVAGRAVQLIAPAAALKMSRIIGLLSILIFFAVVLLTARLKNPAMKQIGITGAAAIILLTLGSWVAGWLLGGPGVANRKVVAISASMRNVGVCMVLANHYFADTSVAIPLLAFSGVTIPMNMIFALATGRVKDKSADVAKKPVGGEPPPGAEILHQQ